MTLYCCLLLYTTVPNLLQPCFALQIPLYHRIQRLNLALTQIGGYME
jgi:hypothetical protein